MLKVNPTTGVIVGLILLVSASGLLAQDWPQWRGANRDGKVKDFTAPPAWPKEFTQKWKVTVGTGDATPALVGDRLYVFARQGSDEIILCLEADTGKEVWKDKYEAPAVTGAAARHPGPRSSPTVADGKVVALGVTGIVSCWDAAKGTLVWRKTDIQGWPQFFTAMSPIVVDGLCIVHLGGQGKGTIVAYDLASGDVKWKWEGDGPGYASPVLLTVEGTKMIVTQTEKNIVGVGVADGKLLWETPFVGGRMAYNAATPIVDGQTIIYTGQGRGTRAVKMEKEGETFAAKEVWSNPDVGTQFNTPVLKDGMLYGLSDRGSFFCLDAKTGTAAWTDTGKHGGNFGAIIDAGSVLLALTSDSQLTVLQPTGKAYTEVARVKVSDKQTYAHPIVAGKRMFVRDLDSVALLTMEPSASGPAEPAKAGG